MATDIKTKKINRIRRHIRVRAKISGTAERPRVSVFRSNRHIFVQLIDDVKHKTLFSSNVLSGKKAKEKGTKTDKAFAAGEALAKKAMAVGIKAVVFDKSGFKYHGRIKAVAEGLRQGGIKL